MAEQKTSYGATVQSNNFRLLIIRSNERKEASGEYEAYTDVALNQWTNLKVVVKGTKAQLFINDSK